METRRLALLVWNASNVQTDSATWCQIQFCFTFAICINSLLMQKQQVGEAICRFTYLLLYRLRDFLGHIYTFEANFLIAMSHLCIVGMHTSDTSLLISSWHWTQAQISNLPGKRSCICRVCSSGSGSVWMETSENNATVTSGKVASGNRRDVFCSPLPEFLVKCQKQWGRVTILLL